MSSNDARPKPAHLSGLDGLRAIAVAAVVLFHLAPAALPGGYIGVDVFFVISGFLITTLLLRERDGDGIRLGRFLARRARRLLPALAIVVLVCSAVAGAIGGDVLVGIGGALIGAVTFSSNWVAVVQGDDYFAATSPQLLRNLWSLGVEEQYYLLWPVLLAVVCLLRPPSRRTIVVAAAAVASAVAMAAIAPTLGAARAYYGTDSHVFGLLGGSALALGMTALGGLGRSTRVDGFRGSRAGQWLGLAALFGLLAAALLLGDRTLLPYSGGLALVVVLAVVVVWTATAPGSLLGRVLDMRPLRYLGERSYGIYLWHWPLVVLVGAVAPSWRQSDIWVWSVPVLVAIATLVIAAASYRFVELPIRRAGFAVSVRQLFSSRRLSRRVLLAGVAVVTVVGLAGTGVAVARAPSMTEGARLVALGNAAVASSLASSNEEAASALQPSDVSPSGAVSGGLSKTDPESETPEDGSQSGSDVTAIGDSVMLAAAPALQAAMPSISIDAAVSRQLGEAPELIRAAEAAGTLRPIVVVGLGTNGPTGWRYLEEVHAAVGERRLVLVNAFGPMEWTDSVNQTLSDFASTTPSVVVADWHSAAAGHADLLAADQTHPGAAAGTLYADAVTAAIARSGP